MCSPMDYTRYIKHTVLIQHIMGQDACCYTASLPEPAARAPRLPLGGQRTATGGHAGGPSGAGFSTRGVVSRAIVALEDARRTDEVREEERSGEEAAATGKLGPEAAAKVPRVSDKETTDLEGDGIDAAHDEGRGDHEVGDELGGDGENEKGGHLTPLVLMNSVAEGHDEARNEGVIRTREDRSEAPGELVEGLCFARMLADPSLLERCFQWCT